MVRFLAVLLRGVIATFAGVLIAGGTLTLAADRAAVQRPTLVSAEPATPTTLQVPDVTGQAYVFAKGILQDHGFSWHVIGPVQGYAANVVAGQRPTAGTVVLDTGAPAITLTLARNKSYVEKGTPENDAPYNGTAIRLPAITPAATPTRVAPTLEPVPVPTTTGKPTVTVPVQTPAPVEPATTTPGNTAEVPAATPRAAPATPTEPVATPSPTGARAPDFIVPGAPKEPTKSASLPDRVVALSAWIEQHREPTAANLNHWLYEHAYIVAGARFGWWHGAQALEGLIGVDKRAETLWGVGTQSRTAAVKALAEVRSRGG
jgi:PASTA domain